MVVVVQDLGPEQLATPGEEPGEKEEEETVNKEEETVNKEEETVNKEEETEKPEEEDEEEEEEEPTPTASCSEAEEPDTAWKPATVAPALVVPEICVTPPPKTPDPAPVAPLPTTAKEAEALVVELLQDEAWAEVWRVWREVRYLLAEEAVAAEREEDQVTAILNVFIRNMAATKEGEKVRHYSFSYFLLSEVFQKFVLKPLSEVIRFCKTL